MPGPPMVNMESSAANDATGVSGACPRANDLKTMYEHLRRIAMTETVLQSIPLHTAVWKELEVGEFSRPNFVPCKVLLGRVSERVAADLVLGNLEARTSDASG